MWVQYESMEMSHSGVVYNGNKRKVEIGNKEKRKIGPYSGIMTSPPFYADASSHQASLSSDLGLKLMSSIKPEW